MLLVPPPDLPDSRPVYHISINLNCFNPLSSITSVFRGATEHGELVAEFEYGLFWLGFLRVLMCWQIRNYYEGVQHIHLRQRSAL